MRPWISYSRDTGPPMAVPPLIPLRSESSRKTAPVDRDRLTPSIESTRATARVNPCRGHLHVLSETIGTVFQAKPPFRHLDVRWIVGFVVGRRIVADRFQFAEFLHQLSMRDRFAQWLERIIVAFGRRQLAGCRRHAACHQTAKHPPRFEPEGFHVVRSLRVVVTMQCWTARRIELR